MEWLFITCHNYWIVCRLVRDDHHPFLAYSPIISICDSSVPFRALLGAILSVVKRAPVEPTEFTPNMKLDTLAEKQVNDPLNTRNHHCTSQRKAESGLMVCPYLLSTVSCHLSCSFILRLPRLPKIRLNPPNFGYISTRSRTIYLPFRSLPRMGNGACG